MSSTTRVTLVTDKSSSAESQERASGVDPGVNVKVLHAALDAARTEKGLSWRQLAKEIGVSASTISRMANGLNPDVGAFAAMTTWLHMPAESFYLTASHTAEHEPELVASLAPLLRARRDLTATDVAYLEEVIGAAARRFRAERDARSS
jgi:transcriptional regulator with XRE-family HTH domain